MRFVTCDWWLAAWALRRLECELVGGPTIEVVD